MKAAVYYGKHNLVVEDVPVRELKDNEVLIQVKYCGVCGTDVTFLMVMEDLLKLHRR